MPRAPFQVLVFPYRILTDGEPTYAIFRRRDDLAWQAIAGGEEGETPLAAAHREAWEEAGIAPDCAYLELDSRATIPAIHFPDFCDRTDLFVIPEYAFAVQLTTAALRLSPEHAESAWLPYAEAHARLRWDSNKTALWELDRRLRLSRRNRPG